MAQRYRIAALGCESHVSPTKFITAAFISLLKTRRKTGASTRGLFIDRSSVRTLVPCDVGPNLENSFTHSSMPRCFVSMDEQYSGSAAPPKASSPPWRDPDDGGVYGTGRACYTNKSWLALPSHAAGACVVHLIGSQSTLSRRTMRLQQRRGF